MTAWIGVLDLLDECPVLAAALTAVVEGCTTTVSPTKFDFISTVAQKARFGFSWGSCPTCWHADHARKRQAQ